MSFAFNLSSDLLMLTVPIPMLLQSQLPLKQCVKSLHARLPLRTKANEHRKITITGVFSLGIFVVRDNSQLQTL